MATPKGLPAVSTPKNPLTSTPNRPTASPRPSAGAFANKTLAYKSPAVKTPASLYSHSHRVSISSQPNSTPLGPPAIHDELLNLNSPAAALIASIGNAGLTPTATAQDGLGITTGITPHSSRDMTAATRTLETDRLNRLDQVTKLLKTKSAGRGITREGVERVARVQGFTIFWDEDNLTVAGNSVDLEIIFDSLEQNVIRDVQLKLNTSSSEEPVLQQDASAILKKHLVLSGGRISAGKAQHNLDEFSQDLEYLNKLDQNEGATSCFELMTGLYTVFRQIWDEEKKRMRDRAASYHICHGNVGRPYMDHGDRLGITSQFWVDRQAYKVCSDSVGNVPAQASVDWEATFSCEKGSPAISSDLGWLEEEPLKTAVTTEDVFQESQIDMPNWSSSAGGKTVDEQQKDADAMMLDGPQSDNPDSLGLVFTCHFAMPVLVPINVANELNSQYPMLQMDQSRALTYQKAIFDESRSSVTQEWHPGIRWSKSVAVFDKRNQHSIREHSYALFANGVPWSYPVSDLRFSHPKQYADTLPVLRQYALLWSILRSTLVSGAHPGLAKSASLEKPDSVPLLKKPTTKRRSNKQPAQDDLEAILGSEKEDVSNLRIDISLDILSELSKAKLEILVPISRQSAELHSNHFVQIVVEVRRNGLIDIPVLRGLRPADEDKIKQKAIKVLSLSEDLSVLIEWLRDVASTAI